MMSIENLISKFGEIPYCRCGCGNRVNVNVKYYYKYKKNKKFPEFITHHNTKTIESKERISKQFIEFYKDLLHKKSQSKQASEFKNKPKEKERMSNMAINWNKQIKQKERIKNLMKNPEISKKIRGKNNGMYGKFGDKHPNWKGGKNISQIKRKEKRKYFISSPLNKKFLNSEEHHIDKQTTIFLPKEIHNRKIGIIHNLQTGYCMNVINTIAYFFLMQQNIYELNLIFNTEL